MRTRVFIALILAALFTSSCSKKAYIFTSFNEPADAGLRMLYSEDGYKWKDFDRIFLKPELGDKIMRDPSMVQGPDGTFHLVWTTGWKGTKGFGYSSSKDLINWTPQRSIEAMKHEPTTVNVWAPEIFYDDVDKQFIIIWASTIPHRFPKGVEAESNNHRMYSITTKDFQTFSETKLFLDPGFSVIDAVIAKMDKGKYALVLKDNTRPNRFMRIAYSDKAMGPYTGVTEPVTGILTEGPSVVKVKDQWLMYFDAYGEKTYSALGTQDFKKFEDVSSRLSIPEGHKHGTIVPVKQRLIKKILKDSAQRED
ncbi:glycosyl hydrolase family 43 [Arcticibacter pallidicorallinus]|uniref:Glycosyl hydrolase family 43 n=1 Tax=Arcticibacter pallidicorallinus TaxID=1259464 RepID=A0A2T0UCB9_9SPHI|nr:glycoside hydrolase family 43 protein [Arcticibacter pallidicorallinus]PRY55586.1 glycosyl hydrolase family 43 [Arcticibacter pallidicorallinus]